MECVGGRPHAFLCGALYHWVSPIQPFRVLNSSLQLLVFVEAGAVAAMHAAFRRLLSPFL